MWMVDVTTLEARAMFRILFLLALVGGLLAKSRFDFVGGKATSFDIVRFVVCSLSANLLDIFSQFNQLKVVNDSN